MESKAKGDNEGGREAVERDSKRGSVRRKSITGAALFPGETVMCALGSGQPFFACLSSLLGGLGSTAGKGDRFAADHASAMLAGANSGANLCTPLGKEEGGQAVQGEEVSKQRACQRALSTPHSPVVVSG